MMATPPRIVCSSAASASSSHNIKAAVSSILGDKDFYLHTPRMKAARQSAKFLDGSPGAMHGPTFSVFATRLEALATPSASLKS